MHVINHPPIPFWGHLEEGVAPGLVIYVAGHIPHSAERFDINLVKGHEMGHDARKHSSIALHVNPRVHDDYVVLNSRKKEHWGDEQRYNHTHQLHRGHAFSITIHVESEYYSVSVNGHHLGNFHHRIPYHKVKTLWIDGDVHIHTVEYHREHSGPHFRPQHVFVPGVYSGHYHQ